MIFEALALIMCRSTTRACDSRTPSQLDLTGFSHLNFGTSSSLSPLCPKCSYSEYSVRILQSDNVCIVSDDRRR